MQGSGITFGNEIKETEESWGKANEYNSNVGVLSELHGGS